MADSPQSEELQALRERLAVLEHRLARLENWVSLPLTNRVPTPRIPTPVDQDTADAPAAAIVLPNPLPVAPLENSQRPPDRPTPPTRPETFDLEAMIGQNWASWVGGIVLLLGICFFLKYAWDQGWIRPSPQVRVIAAVALGAAVCAAGEWVWRKRMRGLAGTLHGTGVAILITSFFGANRYFDPPVLSRGVAFAGVAIAAAAGIYLAFRVNVLTVAILALVGAYLSPAVLSSGQDKSLELLAYLAILAGAQWVISFVKGARANERDPPFQWLWLRWLALAGSFIWFFVWWNGFGQRYGHHNLALAWLALIYFGFLAEIFLTLQVAMGRMRGAAEEGAGDLAANLGTLLRQPIGAPAPDGVLGFFSLITTAITFAAMYVVLEDEPRSVVAAIALALAATQALVAAMTVSRALMWSALLQSAALVTISAPLWLDDFSITLAWLALAAAIAAMAWQFNLPAARGWVVVLLLLALARLVIFDSSTPSMRTLVARISDQPISRWLLMAWSTAVLFHIVAWMQPRRGAWPAVQHWLGDASAAKCSLQRTRGGVVPVLDYAPPPPVAQSAAPDATGAWLAALGTMLFIIASAWKWEGPMLTLLGIAWLAPIILLAVPGRRISYITHAMLLFGLIALHWLTADNLNPLLQAWSHPSRDTTLPLLNLAALAGLLLCAAIVVLARMSVTRDFRQAEAGVVVSAILFAWLTFESWRAVDYAANHGPAIHDPAIVKQMAMSVLWSLIGFAAIVIGFWKHMRQLRVAALVLLGVTLAKIFIVDMKDVKAVWRILSFIALGSLLLGVSYLYHQHQQQNRRES